MKQDDLYFAARCNLWSEIISILARDVIYEAISERHHRMSKVGVLL